MSNHDAILRAVLVNPADDLARLTFADYLDDRDGPGDAEHAEFIRVQCRIEEIGRELRSEEDCDQPCCNERKLLRGRERELWLLAARPVFDPTTVPAGFGIELAPVESSVPYLIVRRGFVAEVRLTLPQFVGGPCGRCRGYGRGSSVSPEGGREYDGPICPACSGTGRQPGVAAALGPAHPITAVRLTDREPRRGPHGWGWLVAANHGRPDSVPRALFKHLSPAAATASLDSPEAATDALIAACVAHLRRLAGLPPLAAGEE